MIKRSKKSKVKKFTSKLKRPSVSTGKRRSFRRSVSRAAEGGRLGMTITDIRDPSFCILTEKNIYLIEKEMRKLNQDGWYPVGGTAKKGNDWVQVMVREKKDE